MKEIISVLPSSDISNDVSWYQKYVGFECIGNDKMYAVLKRDHFSLHLQWHANTPDDPLNGGSVIRIWVEDIEPYLEEFLSRGTISEDKLRRNTDWGTHEFGFYDPNGNAIFIFQNAHI